MLAEVLQKRWSTELITYEDRDDLITNLGEKLLNPAEAKVRELRVMRLGSPARLSITPVMRATHVGAGSKCHPSAD